MEEELSLISKYGSQKNLKLKNTQTTGHQTRNQSGSITSFVTQESNQQLNQQKRKNLQKRMDAISKAQQSLHQKCQKIIENLTNEIRHKDQVNIQLASEIVELRQNIESSKTDLEIIKNYINKQKMKDQKSGRRDLDKYGKKLVLDSTKDSGHVDKSLSGHKADLSKSGSSTKLKAKGRAGPALFASSKGRRQNAEMFVF